MTKQSEEDIKMSVSTCVYAMETPGAPNLQEVNENTEVINTKRAKQISLSSGKRLYVTKRMGPDIEPEVAYFTTQVANINVDDWKKMKLCITFIKQIKEYKRIIGGLNLN